MFFKLSKIIPFAILALLVFISAPGPAFAHQPRLVNSETTQVVDPEISKAYYATLTGSPHFYTIDSKEPFDLYVNVLVPDIAGQKKDVSATILKVGDKGPFATLVGPSFDWKKFYEPFGADTYWMGPEYKARAEAGTYEIRVSSSNYDSKYSLAIGEIEAFDGKEGMNALTLIPQLKKDFWGESPIGFISSPFGWGLIVAMYLLAFIVGFIYRAILKKFARQSAHGAPQNIGKPDRLLRAVIGVGLLLWAITTTWSPILIFFSGFAFFESIFSWCALNQLIGKNTCDI